MGKVYLFHNEEPSLKPRSFNDYLSESMEEVVQKTIIYKTYGNRNTGTYMMTDTLKKIVDADRTISRFHEFDEHVDTVVTNILHRIGGNLKIDFGYWGKILEHTDRVVPLSLGFAFENGQIAPMSESLKRFLEILAERIELGVRTEYDADFLNKNGIRNVRVIGCPSLFYHLDPEFKVDDTAKEVKSVNFNFTSDFANLGISQKEAVDIHWKLLLWIKWQYERLPIDVHLTLQKPPFAEICDMHNILLTYGEIHPLYKDCGRYFYSANDWIEALKKDDFSMGSRFHGNVAAVLAGIPTLMVNVDNRMRGMNDYYAIPSIDIEDFELDRPLEYYRELADYSEFNKRYKSLLNNFLHYCQENGVPLKAAKASGLD